MKRLLPLLILTFIVQSLAAQVLERRHIDHQNRNRTYLIYIPSTYDANSAEKVPVIFAFHGINATDENLTGVGLNTFAERENFIVIYPQAAQVEFGFIAWNCGTLLAANIDDVGFFNAILDLTMTQYNIDDKRVYACGYSMGGMMANRIGCELSDRVTAIASVSGPITQYVYANCEPVRSVPYMHFHGTADETVPYSGIGVVGVKSAEATIQWWAERNGCNTNYELEAVPDTADDWYHVDRYLYPDCNEYGEVIHHRIAHWPHAWPGPTRNVYATAEIVKFFMRHELQDQEIITSVYDEQFAELAPNPNPFSDRLDLSNLDAVWNDGSEMQWRIYNGSGQQMTGGTSPGILDTRAWPNGIYFFLLESKKGTSTYKLVK